jgi:predicted ABC-class ATPase
MEALEAGSRLLLIDEDTSATNFMIRDARMQRLIGKPLEPITPFVDKVSTLYRQHGVSTILVMGGSGDYLEVADQVIAMQEYLPQDVRAQVDRVLAEHPSQRRPEGGRDFGSLPDRQPLPTSFDASRGRRPVKINAKGLGEILFGRTLIDLSALEQLVDPSQTNAIGGAIHCFARHCASQGMTVQQGIQELDEVLNRQGLDVLKPFKVGNLARPRRFEIAAAINRMRTLKIGGRSQESGVRNQEEGIQRPGIGSE